MRAQILMLRKLSAAYGLEGDRAKEAENGHATLLYHHALAYLRAADALQAEHHEVIARCATTPAGGLTETPDEEGAGS